jgi:hypothetical protein
MAVSFHHNGHHQGISQEPIQAGTGSAKIVISYWDTIIIYANV